MLRSSVFAGVLSQGTLRALELARAALLDAS
jgi:hypothetical protein